MSKYTREEECKKCSLGQCFSNFVSSVIIGFLILALAISIAFNMNNEPTRIYPLTIECMEK